MNAFGIMKTSRLTQGDRFIRCREQVWRFKLPFFLSLLGVSKDREIFSEKYKNPRFYIFFFSRYFVEYILVLQSK